MRRIRLSLLVLIVTASCASGPSRPGPNDDDGLTCEVKGTIEIDDNGIRPELTRARVGEAITVTNRGTTDRGLTSDTIDTGTMRPRESTTVCLTEEDTVEVYDRIDSSHRARIEVSPKADS